MRMTKRRSRLTGLIVMLLGIMLCSSCSPTDLLAFLAGCKNGSTGGGDSSSTVAVSFDKSHYTPPAKASNPLVERAVRWAEAIALDDSHGYSQARRNNRVDYDCSSLVWYAYKEAGLPLGDGWPFATGSMGAILKSQGFQESTWSGDPGDAGRLQRGDVLVDPAEHTEIVVGGNLWVGAHHACPGGIEDGKSGDQCGSTGDEEIGIGPAYATSMRMVYRYMGSDKPAQNPPTSSGTDVTVSAAWTCSNTGGVASVSYSGDGVHASADDAKSIARQQLKNGYRQWDNENEYQCLVWVWDHESGWRWNAENPTSGAYGIPQALPAKKLGEAGSDWHENAGTQITWGLNYIRTRYGSPCGAKQFWQQHNWY
jgi:cell wall-associated NlpC family hydrolase